MTKEIRHRIESQIKGHNVTERLATLAAIETRLDSLCLNGKSEVPFKTVGNWLVSEEILWDRLRPSSRSRFGAS
jgi:hypothetical protein